MVGFGLLCGETLDPLMKLRVAEADRHLIAPNAEWIAQAALSDDVLTYGMFDGDRAVGMLSLIDPRCIDVGERAHFQEGCLYLWRLMIDGAVRRQGYGRAAVDFAKGYARLIGLDGVSLTTMDRSPVSALPLYEREGFVPTGRRLDGEIELVWRG